MRRMTMRRLGAYSLTVGLWGIALLLLALAVGVMFVHIDAGEPGGRRVPVSEPLFSGLRISTARTPGYAGLRIGSARYASRRAGLFVIGNTRRLILEDVDLVFGPDSPLAEAPEGPLPGRGGEASVIADVLPGSLAGNIAGLEIRRVRLFRRDPVTGSEICFLTAQSARLTRGSPRGLLLEGARFLRGGVCWLPLRQACLAYAPDGHGFILTAGLGREAIRLRLPVAF